MKQKPTKRTVSIIIPAKNEAPALQNLLAQLKKMRPDCEIIVVNDGSKDDTQKICEANQVMLINHPYSMGNGAAIKSGVRAATHDTLIMMDADGQHSPDLIQALIDKFEEGYDMVVASRDQSSHAHWIRRIGNYLFNRLSSYIVGHTILDLTSGFRIVDKNKFKEFMHLLPNGFSYPTTITMAFFKSAYTVAYLPTKMLPRVGKSHLHWILDGFRFLLIIYKMATLYSPLKLFLPFALLHFLAGLLNYAHTYFTTGRFTNMSALLLSTSIIIFLLGLISEQITMLIYNKAPHHS